MAAKRRHRGSQWNRGRFRFILELVGHDALGRSVIRRAEAPEAPIRKAIRAFRPLQVQAPIGSVAVGERHQRLHRAARHAHGGNAAARRERVRGPVHARRVRRLGHRFAHVDRQGANERIVSRQRRQAPEAFGLALGSFRQLGRAQGIGFGGALPREQQHAALAQVEHPVGVAAGPSAFQLVAELISRRLGCF